MYRTPDGYYDEFYIFPFDFDAITGLVRNGNLQNAVVPIPGGYDFILRRITGLDRIFTHGSGTAIGKFQFRTSGQNNVFFGNGLTMARVGDTNSVALNMADFMVIPELLYPGTGGIGFDIFNFGANMADIAAQAVFSGVRRRQGGNVGSSYNRKFRRMPYDFVFSIPVTWASSDPLPTRPFFQTVTDFDLEVHNIALANVGIGTGVFSDEASPPDSLTLIAKAFGAAGNGITLSATVGGPNQALSITVVGKAITIFPATNGASSVTTTWTQTADLINSTPASSALVTAIAGGSAASVNALDFTIAITTINGGVILNSPGGTFGPIKIVIFNYAQDALMTAPVYVGNFLEPMPWDNAVNQNQFIPLNGSQSGCIVPPLLFPKDSQVRIDVNVPPFVGGGLNVPASQAVFHYRGMQRQPC